MVKYRGLYASKGHIHNTDRLNKSIYLEATQVMVIKLGRAGYNATKSRL